MQGEEVGEDGEAARADAVGGGVAAEPEALVEPARRRHVLRRVQRLPARFSLCVSGGGGGGKKAGAALPAWAAGK